MDDAQVFISNLVASLLLVTVVGVVVRGRARFCWSFLVYLVAVLLGNRLTTWWPERFYQPGFWALKGITYNALTVLVAVEVGLLTFQRAPGARRRMVVGMAVIAAAAVAVALWPRIWPARPDLALFGVLAPRGDAIALWLFALVFGLAGWHRLPLHPYHRALVLGRTLYLTFGVILLAVLGARADSAVAYSYLAALDPLAFATVSAWWAWAAWRPLELERGVLARLQPWAAAGC
jgi:hypothetical protein